MSGGLINDNRAVILGGGIILGSVTNSNVQTEFLMSGGEIRNNEAGKGGGVFFSGGIFTMSNDALISGNVSTADDYPGGGGIHIDGEKGANADNDRRCY